MRDKIYNWAIKYQAAISFVLVLMLFALGAGLSIASANELPEGLKGEEITIPVICGETTVLYRELYKTHGELPVAIGFTTSNTAVVYFVNEDRTTLSIVIDTPHRSCMIYTSTCLEGDCYMTPAENYENQKDKALDTNTSPKVSL
jgi:hypothetical protein